MKPWFGWFNRAVELHFTDSTVHTSRADACAESALIAFSSSPSFDPAANSVARPFTSCTVSLGILPELLSELGAGTTFFFFFFGIRFAAGTHSCSSKRGSDSSVSLLYGAIFRFFEEAVLLVLAFFFGFLPPETWALAGGASAVHLSASPCGAPSGRTETGTSEQLCCRGCSSLLVAVVLEDVEAWGPFHCSRMLHLLQVGGPTHSCRTPQSSLPQDLVGARW